jgi:hypothetical protein
MAAKASSRGYGPPGRAEVETPVPTGDRVSAGYPPLQSDGEFVASLPFAPAAERQYR